MTARTALPKTKAEQSLAADFAARAGELPGTATTKAMRRQAMTAFERIGLPHRRVEAWKYTDLRTTIKEFAPFVTRDEAPVSLAQLNLALGPLANVDATRIVFVNGSYRQDLSDTLQSATFNSIGAALRAGQPPANTPLVGNEAVMALNSALVTDGALIQIGDGLIVSKPIIIVCVNAGANPKLTSLRHIVRAGRGTEAIVVECNVSLPGSALSQSNSVLQIAASDAANLTHLKVSLEGSAATHIETITASLGANATLKSFQLTTGTGLARTQTFVTFTGENAKLDISGLMLGRGRDHIDTTLVIDHAVPGCESRELFKAVLDDTARAVFQGKVIVRPDAQKTDGKQMAKALMLSEACEFDSKPELEIYADDVVCGHGATVAEIDPAMMFYLRSRGIPRDEARTMLIESFVGEALDKIDDETMRETLRAITQNWLAAGQT